MRTPEYITWDNMKARCYRKSYPSYKHYGGRGVKVCDKWLSFKGFLEDMGLKPSPKHQIDRIDGNGDYTPENCRWITHQENMENCRHSKWWYIKGDKHPSARQAAKACGVASSTIIYWCRTRNDCYSELKYGE